MIAANTVSLSACNLSGGRALISYPCPGGIFIGITWRHIAKDDLPSLDYRELLRRKGWSLRTAAPLLGVHFSHLHHVLKGRRESRALLSRIEELPTREKP